MKRILSVALLSVLATSSYAFELQSLRSSDLTRSAAPALPASAPAAAAQKAYQSLWMSVMSNPSWGEEEADDFSSGIEVRVRKTGGSFFSVSVRVDNGTEFVHLSKFGSGFSLSGAGVNLSMNGMSVNGSVDGKFVNVSAFRHDVNGLPYFSVNGYGLNFSFSNGSINGSFDDKEVSKKAVAGVVALVLAAHADAFPKDKAAASETERVWLTYRNSGGFGWNAMEASDPFANIEVGIRKGFVRDYDAEIEVDDSRENGTVSNFFSDRWEYRGRGADLKLDTFGSFLDLEGTVYGPDGKAVRVDLRVTTTFGPGSLSINERGLRLVTGPTGVSADIDTKVYPKSLVAYIAAIAMSMQHHGLNPNDR